MTPAAGLNTARIILALISGLLLAHCTPAPPLVRDAGHPLANRIWAVDEAAFVSPQTLAARMANARFVLLGERHDNPHHQRLQAWAVRALVERNRQLALVAEMIAADQTPGLALFYEQPRETAETLRTFISWDASGWPDWSLYAPIFDTAVLGSYPIRAGNLDRTHLATLHRRGWAALPMDERARLDLPDALPERVSGALKAAIRDGHCGSLDEAVVARFAEIQFARDATIAMAMINGAARDGAVLIAGAGHVRRDVGVPWQIARLGARGTVLTVAFIEVVPGLDRPEDYATLHDGLPFDHVWFTPAEPRGDPCDLFSAEDKSSPE